MSLTTAQVEELIQALNGTCESMSLMITSLFGDQYDDGSLSIENHDQIDNQIFCCETCGWWYELCDMHEESEENECEGCYVE